MNIPTPYRRSTIATRGGQLTVGTWGRPDATPLIALHGVTGTHQDWTVVGPALSDRFRLIALDLRGRGGSAEIVGPWGMQEHADDVIAVLDHEEIDRAVLVGHSMGGFVAVLAGVLHPDRVAGLVLVDGGLPAVEANEGGDALTRIVLDAARARLDTVFATPQEYHESIRTALSPGQEFTADDAQIADYDLRPTEGGWRISGTYDAIEADAHHIAGNASDAALRSLTRPAILLRATHGLPPRTEGLYSAREVAEWTAAVPALEAREIAGVDHGSIMRNPSGVSAIAEAVEDVRARNS